MHAQRKKLQRALAWMILVKMTVIVEAVPTVLITAINVVVVVISITQHHHV